MQAVLRIRILWILTILASWIRIQGAKYQPKTAKKNFLLQNPNLNLRKKKDYTTFLISEWYINKRKQVIQNIWKFCVVKNSVNFKEITWIWIRIRIWINFFQCGSHDPDPHLNKMDPKHWYQPSNSTTNLPTKGLGL